MGPSNHDQLNYLTTDLGELGILKKKKGGQTRLKPIAIL